MSPDLEYYTNQDAHAVWENNTAKMVMGEAAYGYRITTEDQRVLTVFSVPDNKNLGFGKILIPLRVPQRKDQKKIQHSLKEEASSNAAFFNGANLASLVVEFLESKSSERFLQRSFNMEQHYSLEGDWFMIIHRVVPRNLPTWREIQASSDIPKSAAGLVESFARKFQGWSVSPLK
jgi:hypothetical protein